MYLNALSAAKKVFVFGSLVFLLRRLSIGYVASIAIVFVIVLSIEIAQTRLVGHTPEITDPMLVLFAAFALVMISEHSARSQPVASTATAEHVREARRSARQEERWVTHTVNLHDEQIRFLEELANEMGGTVSRATRRIVANFIEESDSRISKIGGVAEEFYLIEAQRVRSMQIGNRVSDNWSHLTLNLRRSQFDWLSRASAALDMSVSRVTRYIVRHFMEQLGDGSDFDSVKPPR